MNDIKIICLIAGNWQIEDLNFSSFTKLALGIGNVLQSIRRENVFYHNPLFYGVLVLIVDGYFSVQDILEQLKRIPFAGVDGLCFGIFSFRQGGLLCRDLVCLAMCQKLCG